MFFRKVLYLIMVKQGHCRIANVTLECLASPSFGRLLVSRLRSQLGLKYQRTCCTLEGTLIREIKLYFSNPGPFLSRSRGAFGTEVPFSRAPWNDKGADQDLKGTSCAF
jgi:hypothetical protein